MFRHAILITIRNFRRHLTINLVNVIGLVTGLCSSILIFLWVQDELKFDKFHKNDDRLFVVLKNAAVPNGVMTFDETPGLLADVLPNDMPEVNYATAVISPGRENNKGVFAVGDVRIEATDLCVSENFFNTFSFDLLEGNNDRVLSNPNDVVISDELSRKLFSTTENVLGKQLQWNRFEMSGTYTVSGVFHKAPANSSLQFDALFNYHLYLRKNQKLTNWKNGGPTTYLVLKEDVDSKSFNRKIANYLQQKGAKESVFIQKFSSRYLHGQYENGLPAGGRVRYVRLFSLIAIFIVVIACINCMNLSIANAFNRFKEIGIKKVVGAKRLFLINQYLVESIVLVFISLLLSIIPLWLLLPVFNRISGKQLHFVLDAQLFSGILVIALIVAIIAGSYPALYLSALKPSAVFKGKLATSPIDLWLRKGLVSFQFAICLLLICGAIVVHEQIRFIQTKNVGYTRNNVIYFALKNIEKGNDAESDKKTTQGSSIASLLAQIRGLPGVVDAACFRHNIAEGRDGGTTDVQWASNNNDEKIEFTDISAGYHFIETLGMQLKEGRSYSEKFGNEKSKIIFNETAIRAMGLNNPVGKIVRIWGEEKQIIGVLKDFHFQSLYETIKPCFIELNERPRQARIMVKLQPGSASQSISEIQKIYGEYNDHLLFEYAYMDDAYESLYKSEKRVEVLSGFFAATVVVISCLGLFGLAAFSIQKRRKEIGIRRVLGSRNIQVLWMLWSEFNRNIIFSLIISVPVSYILLKNWLNDFAYRISLSSWYFILAAALVVIIAGLAVASQTIRALRVKPARSLRSE